MSFSFSLNAVDVCRAHKSLHELVKDKKNIDEIKEFLDFLSEESKIKFLEELNEESLTPLFTAICHHQYEIVQLLVEHGADVNYQTPENHASTSKTSILHIIARFGLYGFLDLIYVPHLDLDLQEEDGRTALMNAAQEGHFKVVKWLCENGADKTLKLNTIFTASDLASIKGYSEISDYLEE